MAHVSERRASGLDATIVVLPIDQPQSNQTAKIGRVQAFWQQVVSIANSIKTFFSGCFGCCSAPESKKIEDYLVSHSEAVKTSIPVSSSSSNSRLPVTQGVSAVSQSIESAVLQDQLSGQSSLDISASLRSGIDVSKVSQPGSIKSDASPQVAHAIKAADSSIVLSEVSHVVVPDDSTSAPLSEVLSEVSHIVLLDDSTSVPLSDSLPSSTHSDKTGDDVVPITEAAETTGSRAKIMASSSYDAKFESNSPVVEQGAQSPLAINDDSAAASEQLVDLACGGSLGSDHKALSRLLPDRLNTVSLASSLSQDDLIDILPEEAESLSFHGELQLNWHDEDSDQASCVVLTPISIPSDKKLLPASNQVLPAFAENSPIYSTSPVKYTDQMINHLHQLFPQQALIEDTELSDASAEAVTVPAIAQSGQLSPVSELVESERTELIKTLSRSAQRGCDIVFQIMRSERESGSQVDVADMANYFFYQALSCAQGFTDGSYILCEEYNLGLPQKVFDFLQQSGAYTRPSSHLHDCSDRSQHFGIDIDSAALFPMMHHHILFFMTNDGKLFFKPEHYGLKSLFSVDAVMHGLEWAYSALKRTAGWSDQSGTMVCRKERVAYLPAEDQHLLIEFITLLETPIAASAAVHETLQSLELSSMFELVDQPPLQADQIEAAQKKIAMTGFSALRPLVEEAITAARSRNIPNELIYQHFAEVLDRLSSKYSQLDGRIAREVIINLTL